jgi:hypothetical protein
MMKSKLTAALLGAAALVFAGSANATVVNFDDLSSFGLVSDGYGGITWNGQWTHFEADQFPYTPASPDQRIYDKEDAGFSFAAPVAFDGAFFSGYDYATVHFVLKLAGVTVATSGSLVPSSTPTFLSSGYSGLVDEVQVVSPWPNFFVMDDVTFNSVPEPATWTLMIGGFGLVGAVLRRRRGLVHA